MGSCMSKDKPKKDKIIKKESNDIKKAKEPKKSSKATINYGIVDYPK